MPFLPDPPLSYAMLPVQVGNQDVIPLKGVSIVSSRDRSDNTGASRPPARQSERPAATPDTQWDIDPAEIDRYLSGRPQRSTDPTQSAQRQRRGNRPADSGNSTSDQLAQLRQMVDPDRDGRSASPRQAAETSRARPVPQQPQPSRSNNQRQSAERTNDVPPTQPPRQTLPGGVRSSQPLRTTPALQEDAWDNRDELLRNDPYVTGTETGASGYLDEYGQRTDTFDEELIDSRPSSRRRGRSSSAPTMPKITVPAMPKIAMPQSVSQAAIFSDVVSLTLIGVGVVSLAAMAILVGNKMGTLPATIPTHVTASGLLENVKGRGALWRLPLLGTFLTLMNLAIAVFVARIDRFASRFILGAALIVQFVAWVAVLRIL